MTHKIAALIEEQQHDPIWNRLTGQLGAGADDLVAAGIGLLAMASGQTARVEKLFGKSPMEGVTRWLDQWGSYATQRGAAMDQLSNLSKTDGIIDATGHLVRMAPDLIAMEATGGLARGTLQAVRAGRVVEAGAEAAETLNAVGQRAGAAYLGTRSAGATYWEAFQAGVDSGKSPEQARADALAPALVTGVLSYATFSTGGTKALTNIFRSEVATRELLEHGFKAFAKDMGVTMGVGGTQMGLDSLAHDIVAQRSYHPELTDEEILDHALKSALNGAAFAGFTRTVQGVATQVRRPDKPEITKQKTEKSSADDTQTSLDTATERETANSKAVIFGEQISHYHETAKSVANKAAGERADGALGLVAARDFYLEKDYHIDTAIEHVKTSGGSLEQMARAAFEIRNAFRTKARNMMANRKLAEYYEKIEPNLTWEQALEKYGHDYQKIIDKSKESRKSVNEEVERLRNLEKGEP